MFKLVKREPSLSFVAQTGPLNFCTFYEMSVRNWDPTKLQHMYHA